MISRTLFMFVMLFMFESLSCIITGGPAPILRMRCDEGLWPNPYSELALTGI